MYVIFGQYTLSHSASTKGSAAQVYKMRITYTHTQLTIEHYNVQEPTISAQHLQTHSDATMSSLARESSYHELA